MKRQLDRTKATDLLAPTCWQREAPCACLRVELTGRETHIFPYQQLVTAKLVHSDGEDTLNLAFATHDVEFTGRNLSDLLHALQDFAVKWVRPVPERYHSIAAGDAVLVMSIRVVPVS